MNQKESELVHGTRVRWREIIILAGAYISYGVGASFGTGISLLQFHGALGIQGILSQLISCVLTFTLIYVVSKDCGTYGLRDIDGLFQHYCGKWLCKAFRWYAVLMLFLRTGSMFSGAATTVHESFGIPIVAGTILMMIAVVITVLLGAKRLIDIIGNIAPFILGAMLIICVYSLIFHSDSLAEGSSIIMESAKDMRMTASPIWAGIMEFGLVIVGNTSYLATVASRPGTSKKELLMGNVSGEGALFTIKILLIFTFILNASVISGSSVPVVTLSGALGSVFGKIYSLVLVLAVYTTAASMAWQVVVNICPESSRWYKLFCVALIVGAYLVTFFGTFSVLMQFLNKLSSYVGAVYIVCLLYTKLFRRKQFA